MANKISNVHYDQIPHVVLNHPKCKPDHIVIMTHLFKVLKDKTKIVYSNTKLSTESRIPLRTVELRVSELNKMGFIHCTGLGRSRRISLGLLLINTAQFAAGESPPANQESPPAKTDSSARNPCGHNKPYTKPYTKVDGSIIFLTHQETKELEHCKKNNFSLSEEFKHLLPLLNEALK